MVIISRWLQLVSWTCALSCSMVASAASDDRDRPDIDDLSTGVTQLHQIFPRNETYTPSPLFPVVFAFQNPTTARSLSPHLSTVLFKWNQTTSDWDVNDTTSFVFDDKLGNASDSEPFFVHDIFGGNFDTEAYWSLAWTLWYSNCTEGEGQDIIPSAGQWNTRVRFTTQKGGRKPDLIASDDSACSKSPSFTWNVTKIAEPNPLGYEGQLCAYISPNKPDPKPCEAQVDSELEESIFTSATNYFCRGLENVDCPPNEDDEEDHGETIRGSLAATFTACFVSFAVGTGLLMM